MSAVLSITRAGPLATIQDAGRFGMLRHGISPSGPMDVGAFERCGAMVGAGPGGIEFTLAGIELRLTSGACQVAFAGGHFEVRHNGNLLDWPGMASLTLGDTLAVTPGRWGNYGYLRFNGSVDLPPVLGSLATNSRVRLGGLDGRALRAGDVIAVAGEGLRVGTARPTEPPRTDPIRVVWGVHAEGFSASVRERFASESFTISNRLDRMGVRLDDPAGVFAQTTVLSLVSEAIVPGDIQILGDGTPIVLMRDHQPTGGYPRIATVATVDLDRFAQLRPGSQVAFTPVTVEHAHQLLRDSRR